MWDTVSPSPEDIYIGNETGFLSVLKGFKEGKRNFHDLITCYLLMQESYLTFEHIMRAYENVIDEREDNWNAFLGEKMEYAHYKQRYDSFKSFRPKHNN